MAVIHYEWRNKPQHVFIDGREFKFKSLIEYRWAQYLQRLLELEAIDFWDYETTTFEFTERHRTKRQYTPDFEVRETLEFGLKQKVFHEVKTSLRQTDIRRFKLMAADFPLVTMVLVLPSCRTGRQSILRGNALKYVARIVYCNPIFNKMGIR
ncbi:MAG TPA: hypothetical protein VMV56_08840 [Williamwhitmania sp.]|nr:hypothetical protein [Williamwhitmania sp.]